MNSRQEDEGGRRAAAMIHARPARDRLEAALARLADETEERKAFRLLYPDMARSAADASDRRRAGGRLLGPLDGQILSIKDLFDVAGSVTTSGSRLLEGRAGASRHAPAVERLLAAGCVPIGRTGMSELAYSGIGMNPNFGTPGNPLDRRRVPGGSSSGAAVSVADGIADIGLGSDTGGSLRIPAALCGVVGFKPGIARVPRAGAFPLSTTLDVVGPIAATVAVCADAYGILAGEAVAGDLAPRPLDGVAIGVVRSARLLADSDAAVIEACARALAILERSGARLRDIDLDDQLDRIGQMQAIGNLPSIELAATIAMLGEADDADALIDPNVLARIRPGREVKAVDYLRLQAMRGALLADVAALFEDVDMLALPTVPLLPPLIEELEDPVAFVRANMLMLRNTAVFNMLDLPAISLPLAVAGGLSTGLMLAGSPRDEAGLLALARAAEHRLR